MGKDVQDARVQFGDDVRAGLAVFLVRMAREIPGAGFHKNLQAEPGQRFHGVRRGGHAPFAVPAFPRYAQFHPGLPSCCTWHKIRGGTAARGWLESMAGVLL